MPSLLPLGRSTIIATVTFLVACAPGSFALVPTVLPSPTSAETFTIEETPTLRPTPDNPTPTSQREPSASPGPTARATVTQSPVSAAARPKATAGVQVLQDWVTLLTYPYESYWRDAVDPVYNIGYKRFDAGAYANATQRPVEKRWKSLVVENRYLRLTFLPELGGRLYQVLYKPTGQTLFYSNAVLKPTPWGPEQQGGWLAAGGMEWALPVNEHGYEWGVPWQYRIDGSTVTLWDTDATDRVRARIAVTLPADGAYFIVHPRVENPTRQPVSLQFWINAALALGGKRTSPRTEFVLRGAQVWIHSTGNDFIPSANVPDPAAPAPAQPVAWPTIGGRDLSRYQNWVNYMGLFLTDSTADLAGVYDHTSELGIARVSPRDKAPGVKLFAFGPEFDGRPLFSDDDSDYVELWGGLPRSFFKRDDVTLAPGASREWEEYWVPFARTGGLSVATQYAVLYLERLPDDRALVSVSATTGGTRGTLVLYRDRISIKQWSVPLDPGQAWRQSVEQVGEGTLKLRFTGADGTVLAETP